MKNAETFPLGELFLKTLVACRLLLASSMSGLPAGAPEAPPAFAPAPSATTAVILKRTKEFSSVK